MKQMVSRRSRATPGCQRFRSFGTKLTPLAQVILHNGGFSDEERHSYAEIVYSNTIQSMQAVLEALPLLKLSLEPQNEDAAALLEELDPDERSVDPTIRAALMALWSDPALKESMSTSIAVEAGVRS